MTHSIKQLRIEAAKARFYAIEESQNKWSCIRKSDMNFLVRGERTETMALRTGLAKTEFL